MQTIYLDNNATTRVDPAVFEAMKPYFTEMYGNPSSMHRFGGQVGVKIKEARASVASLLGCAPEEIIFTSCGSESDNTAIRSALTARPDRRHIITTAVEHPAILSLCKFLEKKDGYEVTYLGTDEYGRLDIEEYKAAIRPDTAVVSIMWANNETGNIYPIEEMAKIAKERDVFFHTDAVQAVGKVDIDLSKIPVDMLSLSGHKLHAPKGVGALFVRKRLPFRPFLIGGHQERSRRAGTENATGIIALGKACELAREHMVEENTEVKRLRDPARKGAARRGPGRQTQRRPGQSAAQHLEHLLRVCGGRGHPADAGSGRHRRQFGIGLHLGQPGAVARAPRHGRAFHLRPRVHPFLLKPVSTPKRRSTTWSKPCRPSSRTCASFRRFRRTSRPRRAPKAFRSKHENR